VNTQIQDASPDLDIPKNVPFTYVINTHLERVCCLLVLNLVSSTLPCIRQPRPRLRVLDICGFVLVCTQALIGF
jgi:hypothetical protein